MKYTRCERLLLVKAFFFVFVAVFSSLENNFGFRTTNVRVSPFLAWDDFQARLRFARSTIPDEKWGTTRSLSVSLRRNKTF